MAPETMTTVEKPFQPRHVALTATLLQFIRYRRLTLLKDHGLISCGCGCAVLFDFGGEVMVSGFGGTTMVSGFGGLRMLNCVGG